MNVVGIIAEYNPFHQGHAFHLTQARELTEADYAVVIMSGNYVQRGAPAIFDKYTRAEAALRNGADLVLELPPESATGSAEYFASGAVSLLEHAGIVTDLCFGSECGDLAFLKHTAKILAAQPDDYRYHLKQHLKTGKSFPCARTEALLQYDSSIPLALMEEPNNLLGIEYLKALERSCSSIRAHTVRRVGDGYHQQHRDGNVPASASGIRARLIQNHGHFTPDLCAQLPSSELYSHYDQKVPITEDTFSLLLLEKLRRNPEEPLNCYFDVSKELANRIWNHLDKFVSFSQFTDLLKTRNLTRTSVSRALLHILLDIREYYPPAVFRILGFRKEAAVLLKELKLRGGLPVVTSLAHADLPKNWLYADRLYEAVRSLTHGQPYQNDYRRRMLVI